MAWEALYVLLLRPASGLERCVAHGAAAVWPAEAEPNGIVLPQPWPPKPAGDVYSEWGSDPPRAYTPPTYLSQPPQTIRVDVGRQLFVDDFLFDASLSSGFAQKWGQAKVASHTVLVPDKPWEAGAGRTARPFGGGVLVDPLNSSRILLWYRCGWRGKRGKTCLAVSGDGGRHFDKPKLDPAGTNVVISSQRVEAFEIAYDFFARPPRFIAQRMEYMTHGKVYQPYETYTSQNGRNWRKRPAAMQQSAMADRSTFFLNPLRAKPVWAWSLRENMCRGGPSAHMRSRRIHEQPRDTFISKAHNRFAPYLGAYFQCPKDFKPNEPVPWTAVDREDCGFKQCDLYNVDGIAYESVLVHALAILHGPYSGGELKNNSIHLGFSRDGYHISRPPMRRKFIDVPPSLANLQLASGSPIVFGAGSTAEKLHFFYGYGTVISRGKVTFNLNKATEAVYRGHSEGTGLAVLRRDGFAWLEPAAAAPAVIVTKPLGFSRGGDVYVNVRLSSAGARLDVEVLDASTLEKLCDVGNTSVQGPLDSTRHKLDISGLEGHAHERLRFRFTLHRGMLYSFWVTSSRIGSSGGFLGGGAIGRVNFAFDAGE